MSKHTGQGWSYFNLKKLKPTREVYRYDDERGNRFYYFYEKGEVVIASGITTCFGEVSTERLAIERWKEAHPNWRHLLKVSSNYGTLEHEVFGDISLGMSIPKHKIEAMESIAIENGKSESMPRKDTLAFMKFCEETQLEPMVVEGVLVWQDDEGNWLAMTIDMLAKLKVPKKVKVQVQDGVYKIGTKKGTPKYKEETQIVKEDKIIVVDFKSNFFEKEKKQFFEAHLMQLIGAKRAVKQNFGIDVDEVYNWSPNNWRSEPSYTFYKHNVSETDDKLFDAYWKVITLKGINKPRGKMLVTDLKNSGDYRFLSYQEYVKEFILTDGQKTTV